MYNGMYIHVPKTSQRSKGKVRLMDGSWCEGMGKTAFSDATVVAFLF